MGQDFTLELQFHASAGYTREMVMSYLEALFEGGVEDKSVFVYERDSKILQRYIYEVTGVWRDPIPRPVVAESLADKLRELLDGA